MNTDLQSNAEEIRVDIRNAEAAADEVMLSLAKARIGLIEARQHPAIPAGAAQAVMLRMIKTEQNVLSSHGDILRAHEGMNDLYREYCGRDEGWPTETGLEPTSARDERPPVEA